MPLCNIWEEENSDMIFKLKQFQLNHWSRETYFILKFHVLIVERKLNKVFFKNNYLDTELSSLSAAIKVSGEEYSTALGDTSTPEFMDAAALWGGKVSSLPIFCIPSFISMNQFIYLFIYLSIIITIIIKYSASPSWKVKRVSLVI